MNATSASILKGLKPVTDPSRIDGRGYIVNRERENNDYPAPANMPTARSVMATLSRGLVAMNVASLRDELERCTSWEGYLSRGCVALAAVELGFDVRYDKAQGDVYIMVDADCKKTFFNFSIDESCTACAATPCAKDYLAEEAARFAKAKKAKRRGY